jgi:hypothetical protein
MEVSKRRGERGSSAGGFSVHIGVPGSHVPLHRLWHTQATLMGNAASVRNWRDDPVTTPLGRTPRRTAPVEEVLGVATRETLGPGEVAVGLEAVRKALVHFDLQRVVLQRAVRRASHRQVSELRIRIQGAQ